MAWFECTGGSSPTPSPTITSIYSLDESQGGVWINTEIDASNYTNFLFVYNENNSNDYIMHQIPVSNIAVYTGGSDVYTTIFNASTTDRPFNVRIYNNLLYVSFNGTSSSSKVVHICTPDLNVVLS